MKQESFPEEPADALVGVQRLIRRRLRREMPAPRLRGAEVELLRLVVERPGIGISDAATERCLAGSSVSTLVNQLARQDLLVRETAPADRRAARPLPPSCFPRSCKGAAGLRARHDCVPLSNATRASSTSCWSPPPRARP